MSKVSVKTISPKRHTLRWREGGTQRQETVRASESAAQRRRIEIEDRLIGGIPDPAKITLADLAQMYFEDGAPRWSDKTLIGYTDQYERLIRKQLGGFKLGKLRRAHVRKWLADMERRGVGREMQRKTLTRLRSIIKFGIEEELLAINVAASVKMPEAPPKRLIYVSPPIEVERQRANAIDAGRDRDALIYSLGFYLGLRPGEIFGLTADSFSGDKIRIDKRRTLKIDQEAGRLKGGGQIEKGSKTKTFRDVDVPAAVVEEIEAYIDAHKIGADELLFPNAQGNPLTESNYRSWRRNRFDKDRVSDQATPYSMRHSAASLMLHAHGLGKLSYVARQLGHSPTESLKTYQHEIDSFDANELISVHKNVVSARRAVRRERAKLRVA